jgi:hypothetical protein
MLQAAFIALTVSLAILLCSGLSRVAGKTYSGTAKASRISRLSLLALAAWLFYIGGTSMTGIFAVASLPPRLPLLLVMPTFIWMALFFKSKKSKELISHTPLRWLITAQAFRVVVELLILQLYRQGVFPKAATFEGYNFDILIGLTAPLVGYLAFRNGKPNKPLLIAWNIAGLSTLAIVVFVLMSHVYSPQMWGLAAGIGSRGGFEFPYTFLAGFLMPVAVFLHLICLVKLKREQ